MKKSIFILLVLITSGVYSQVFRPLLNLSTARGGDFEKNEFFEIGLGAEFKVKDFLIPELVISYSVGNLGQSIRFNDNNEINASSKADMTAVNFAFSPKIAVYSNSTKRVRLYISPKYNYSIVNAQNEFVNAKSSGEAILPYEFYQSKSNIQSLGIGLGFCVDFSEKDSDSMAVNLFFNNIEHGNAFNKLSKMNKLIDTSSSVGLGITYYFNFKNRYEEKILPLK